MTNPDVTVPIRARISDWLTSEGLRPEPVQVANADFAMKTDSCLVVRPAGSDKTLIASAFSLDQADRPAYQGLSASQRSDLEADLAALLHGRSLAFRFVRSDSALDNVTVARAIYDDGLSKDHFMSSILELTSALAEVGLFVGNRLRRGSTSDVGLPWAVTPTPEPVAVRNTAATEPPAASAGPPTEATPPPAPAPATPDQLLNLEKTEPTERELAPSGQSDRDELAVRDLGCQANGNVINLSWQAPAAASDRILVAYEVFALASGTTSERRRITLLRPEITRLYGVELGPGESLGIRPIWRALPDQVMDRNREDGDSTSPVEPGPDRYCGDAPVEPGHRRRKFTPRQSPTR